MKGRAGGATQGIITREGETGGVSGNVATAAKPVAGGGKKSKRGKGGK